jgi:DNA-binding NtrC family response regulator
MGAVVATVLIVEDDPIIRWIVEEGLIDFGHVVIAVSEAGAAIERLTSGEAIDVLLTDVNLPGEMDGIELATWITVNAPAVLTLVMSGRRNAKAQVERRCKNATFFPKPFLVEDLHAHIQSVRTQLPCDPVRPDH